MTHNPTTVPGSKYRGQIRQQVTLTITVDVAAPTDGMDHVLVPERQSGEECVPAYRRADMFADAITDQVNGLLRDSTWDGGVAAIDYRLGEVYDDSQQDF